MEIMMGKIRKDFKGNLWVVDDNELLNLSWFTDIRQDYAGNLWCIYVRELVGNYGAGWIIRKSDNLVFGFDLSLSIAYRYFIENHCWFPIDEEGNKIETPSIDLNIVYDYDRNDRVIAILFEDYKLRFFSLFGSPIKVAGMYYLTLDTDVIRLGVENECYLGYQSKSRIDKIDIRTGQVSQVGFSNYSACKSNDGILYPAMENRGIGRTYTYVVSPYIMPFYSSHNEIVYLSKNSDNNSVFTREIIETEGEVLYFLNSSNKPKIILYRKDLSFFVRPIQQSSDTSYRIDFAKNEEKTFELPNGFFIYQTNLGSLVINGATVNNSSNFIYYFYKGTNTVKNLGGAGYITFYIHTAAVDYNSGFKLDFEPGGFATSYVNF